ncbi:MAG: hypothetical protein KDA81_15685 [Planctomycetaceae bacterium]|nr:hypothetical protein [Planctomycetaceae bacterium]
MRMRIKDGRWFETTEAVRINDKLWYTRRGNWIYHRLAEPDFVEEKEAVQIMLADGNWFEDHPGFLELPENVRQQLYAHLNAEFPPQDEV